MPLLGRVYSGSETNTWRDPGDVRNDMADRTLGADINDGLDHPGIVVSAAEEADPATNSFNLGPYYIETGYREGVGLSNTDFLMLLLLTVALIHIRNQQTRQNANSKSNRTNGETIHASTSDSAVNSTDGSARTTFGEHLRAKTTRDTDDGGK